MDATARIKTEHLRWRLSNQRKRKRTNFSYPSWSSGLQVVMTVPCQQESRRFNCWTGTFCLQFACSLQVLLFLPQSSDTQGTVELLISHSCECELLFVPSLSLGLQKNHELFQDEIFAPRLLQLTLKCRKSSCRRKKIFFELILNSLLFHEWHPKLD